MAGILIAVVFLVIYGSLYPWNFQPAHFLGSPFRILFLARSISFERRILADIIINVALYVPVGMSAFLAFRRIRWMGLRTLLPVLLGFVLSAGIEMTQLYVPGRRCSVIDLLTNTVGTVLGVVCGMFFETVADGIESRRGKKRPPDRSALALLLVWAGSLLFPLMPVMWLYMYRRRAAELGDISLSWATLIDFLSAGVSWYLAGHMLRAVGLTKRWLWLSLSLVPMQFFIVGRLPTLPGLLGAVGGIAAFLLRPDWNAGWLALALIAIRGLVPLRLGPMHSFSFLPFSGFLEMDWQTGIRVLLEKCWFLGAALWGLRPRGRTFAMVAVGGLALAIEVLQMWISGRTAEIADPLLALAMAWVLFSLRPGGVSPKTRR